ncbi:MAG: hypothetical protein J6L85_00685 [Clostridia bacterium]|nr:hypothetical protein [Clostridia bacterium]
MGIIGAEINEDGELVLVYSDGSSIPAASAKGLRSAVSIVCNFQATIQQGGWRPGSSSTTTQDYSSAGSGVIYQMDKAEGDAFIITNYHVVYDASSNTENGISDDISVYLYGSEIEEKAIEATYVGGSLYYDSREESRDRSRKEKDKNGITHRGLTKRSALKICIAVSKEKGFFETK